MRIKLEEISRHGNNVLGRMYFDDIIVARDIQCSPKEWDEFQNLLRNGYDALYTEVELEVVKQ